MPPLQGLPINDVNGTFCIHTRASSRSSADFQPCGFCIVVTEPVTRYLASGGSDDLHRCEPVSRFEPKNFGPPICPNCRGSAKPTLNQNLKNGFWFLPYCSIPLGMSVFYDTHAHLAYPDYANDLPQVLARANDAGITKIICVATDLQSSLRVIQLSEKHSQIFAAIGWHPSDALLAPADFEMTLRKLACHPRVVAIGETGLDYYRLPSKMGQGTVKDDEKVIAVQKDLFNKHLHVASDMGLNCIIHQRDSLADSLSCLETFRKQLRSVFHCFVDDLPTAQRIFELDCLVSFTGIITFKNAQAVRQTLAAIPMDRFMLETDCPYLAPVPYRGKRCEPTHIRDIAMAVAETKSCSLDEVSDCTCRTADAFFKRRLVLTT